MNGSPNCYGWARWTRGGLYHYHSGSWRSACGRQARQLLGGFKRDAHRTARQTCGKCIAVLLHGRKLGLSEPAPPSSMQAAGAKGQKAAGAV